MIPYRKQLEQMIAESKSTHNISNSNKHNSLRNRTNNISLQHITYNVQSDYSHLDALILKGSLRKFPYVHDVISYHNKEKKQLDFYVLTDNLDSSTPIDNISLKQDRENILEQYALHIGWCITTKTSYEKLSPLFKPIQLNDDYIISADFHKLLSTQCTFSNKSNQQSYRTYWEELSSQYYREDVSQAYILLAQSLFKHYKETTESLYWAQKAYDINRDAITTNLLGNLLMSSKEESDQQQAIQLLLAAVDLGSNEALSNLGYAHIYGHGVEKNIIQGIEYYHQAHKEGVSVALYNLAMLTTFYIKSSNPEDDHQYAYELCLEGIDTYDDPGPFYSMIGLIHHKTTGTFKNYDKAKEYYEKAIQHDHLPALHGLGQLYYQGFGVEKNLSIAKEYCETFIEHTFGKKCFYTLGIIHTCDQKNQYDPYRSREYFNIAVDEEPLYASFMLGQLYEKVFTNEDFHIGTSLSYYYEAAELKHTPAMEQIGLIYKNGKGEITKNIDQALDWFKNAEKHGSSQALLYIGDCYKEGHQTGYNPFIASRYYKSALKKGNPHAQKRLDDMLANEHWVTKCLRFIYRF